MFGSSLILSAILSFGSAGLLLWGLAVFVPVAIHLWNRRRYDQMPWAAMQFLSAAVRKNARRLRLEQWLLLLLRCLILLGLAIALADPTIVWPSDQSAVRPADGPRHVVLVVDTSYSMQYATDGVSSFERACEAADRMVEAANQGDRFSLITLSRPPQVMIGRPAVDHPQVRNEIAELTIAEAGADLAATFELIIEVLAEAARAAPEIEARRVMFLTDLDRQTWACASLVTLEQQLSAVAQRALLSVVDVGQPATRNLVVSDLSMAETIATSDRDMTIQATIRHTPTPSGGIGDKEMGATAELQLLIDGRPISRRTATVPAGGETTMAFEHRFEHVGDVAVEVRLADDNLPIDNHRYLAVPVRQSLRVLCVEGKRGAAANIALALDPHDTGERHSVNVRNQRALHEMELNDLDVVFLCNVARFDADEAKRLADYCRHGGGLVVFLGDQVQPENYNQRLADLFPVRLGEVSPEGVYAFDPRDYGHPLVAPFRGFERAGLLTTPVWRYQRLAAPVDTARTALWFANGDMAIVERPIDRGRVIVVATAGSSQSVDRRGASPTPWNAWSTWPSFPPIVNELLHRAAERAQPRAVLVGQSFGDQLSNPVGDPQIRIEEPSGGQQWLLAQPEGSVSRWDFGPVRRSGVYSVYEEAGDAVPRLFAANVDTQESQLERVSPQELPDLLRYEESTQTPPVVESPATGWQLFRILLGLVLTLLACESVLAWWLGSRTA